MDEIAKAFIEKSESSTGRTAKIVHTPGYLHKVLRKNDGEIVDIENYRSLVGKRLFYIVKVGPDCVNAGRDLARHIHVKSW